MNRRAVTEERNRELESARGAEGRDCKIVDGGIRSRHQLVGGALQPDDVAVEEEIEEEDVQPPLVRITPGRRCCGIRRRRGVVDRIEVLDGLRFSIYEELKGGASQPPQP